MQAISRLLDILLQNLSEDVQHVVESIADGQSSAVAVLWHVRARGASLLHAKVQGSLIFYQILKINLTASVLLGYWTQADASYQRARLKAFLLMLELHQICTAW